MNKYEMAIADIKETNMLFYEPLEYDTISTIEVLYSNFNDCKNELCLMCGNRKEEHKGACNGCRWK